MWREAPPSSDVPWARTEGPWPCLFPEPALEYFRWRDLPIGARPETPADLERKEIEKKGEPAKKDAPKPKAPAPKKKSSAAAGGGK